MVVGQLESMSFDGDGNVDSVVILHDGRVCISFGQRTRGQPRCFFWYVFYVILQSDIFSDTLIAHKNDDHGGHYGPEMGRAATPPAAMSQEFIFNNTD